MAEKEKYSSGESESMPETEKKRSKSHKDGYNNSSDSNKELARDNETETHNKEGSKNTHPAENGQSQNSKDKKHGKNNSQTKNENNSKGADSKKHVPKSETENSHKGNHKDGGHADKEASKKSKKPSDKEKHKEPDSHENESNECNETDDKVNKNELSWDEIQEIDKLFENTVNETKDDKATKLIECTQNIPAIYPYLNLINQDIEALRKIFSIYDIQLGTIADDLNLIQEKNRKLEVQTEYEMGIYNCLSELCAGLSLDESHFEILENGSFVTVEDLVAMETSLNVISEIDLGKYTIRIVKEKQGTILDAQRQFLKRFVTHMKKLFVEPRSSGELKVHRTLYQTMSKYRFIYHHAKRFPDYYSVLCTAYTIFAKKIYENEFETHLEIIYDLADDDDKLRVCIDVLLQSYETLVACEVNFLGGMGIEEDVSYIFKNINSLVIDFVDDMYRKSGLPTILAIGKHIADEGMTKEEGGKNIFFNGFRRELKQKYLLLEDLYIKSLDLKKIGAEKISDLNWVIKSDAQQSLKSKMEEGFIKQLKDVKKAGKPAVASAIVNTQLIGEIESTGSLKKEAIDELIEKISEMAVGFVFSDGDAVENTQNLLKIVDGQKAESNRIIKEIENIVLEHAEDRNKMKEVFGSLVPG
ncbi:hypothetical protein ENBRE01_1195 [Enteropsectra breve]|nr:hypothetical protein ENBRE01_1195 [Enteropsectra breve]